jgi:cysteine-rich repeat protein
VSTGLALAFASSCYFIADIPGMAEAGSDVDVDVDVDVDDGRAEDGDARPDADGDADADVPLDELGAEDVPLDELGAEDVDVDGREVDHDEDYDDDHGEEYDVDVDVDVDVDAGPRCGNGAVEGTEECDDGNETPGDGCENDCTYSCHDAEDCHEAPVDDPCTIDSCDDVTRGRACGHAIDEGAGCDDGDACTTPDTCDAAGECGGPNTCGCPGGTTAECARFEDGNRCNGTLHCVSRLCEVDPATVISCPADPVCRRYACDPADGSCDLESLSDGTTCDDGMFCTLTDSCQSGLCTGSGTPCPIGGCNAGCHETGDLCLAADAGTTCASAPDVCGTNALCDGMSTDCPGPGFRAAGFSCRPAADACDVGEACTGDSYACPADGFAAPGTSCDDAEFCTGVDTCAGDGTCTHPGSPCMVGTEVCNETTDHCDPSGGGCVISGTPYSDGTTNPANQCEWCHVATSTTAWSPKPDFTACSVVTTPDRSYDICSGGTCVSPGCGDASCNAPGPSFPLPDTNQRTCYDNSAALGSCPGSAGTTGCETTPFCGQDAQYGWDVTCPACPRFARSGTTEPVVTDNVTGLMWQGCWAERNGTLCAGGSDVTKNWSTALSYCDGLIWGGHSDWRLPDEFELQSIVDYGRSSSPTIDTTAFPATPADVFWSSSSFAGSASYAWYVAFYDGHVNNFVKPPTVYVRCVRRGP